MCSLSFGVAKTYRLKQYSDLELDWSQTPVMLHVNYSLGGIMASGGSADDWRKEALFFRRKEGCETCDKSGLKMVFIFEVLIGLGLTLSTFCKGYLNSSVFTRATSCRASSPPR